MTVAFHQRNVLFLDFDGVLNNEADFDKWYEDHKHLPLHERPNDVLLDRAKCELLNDYLMPHNVEVVISSAWGFAYPTEHNAKSLYTAGLRLPVTDTTPRRIAGSRGDEIRSWLRAHPSVDMFAAVDDQPYNLKEMFNHNFVKTNCIYGLEEDDARRLAAIYSGDNEDARTLDFFFAIWHIYDETDADIIEATRRQAKELDRTEIDDAVRAAAYARREELTMELMRLQKDMREVRAELAKEIAVHTAVDSVVQGSDTGRRKE